jgi:hypothetical protein
MTYLTEKQMRVLQLTFLLLVSALPAGINIPKEEIRAVCGAQVSNDPPPGTYGLWGSLKQARSYFVVVTKSVFHLFSHSQASCDGWQLEQSLKEMIVHRSDNPDITFTVNVSDLLYLSCNSLSESLEFYDNDTIYGVQSYSQFFFDLVFHNRTFLTIFGRFFSLPGEFGWFKQSDVDPQVIPFDFVNSTNQGFVCDGESVFQLDYGIVASFPLKNKVLVGKAIIMSFQKQPVFHRTVRIGNNEPFTENFLLNYWSNNTSIPSYFLSPRQNSFGQGPSETKLQDACVTFLAWGVQSYNGMGWFSLWEWENNKTLIVPVLDWEKDETWLNTYMGDVTGAHRDQASCPKVIFQSFPVFVSISPETLRLRLGSSLITTIPMKLQIVGGFAVYYFKFASVIVDTVVAHLIADCGDDLMVNCFAQNISSNPVDARPSFSSYGNCIVQVCNNTDSAVCCVQNDSNFNNECSSTCISGSGACDYKTHLCTS